MRVSRDMPQSLDMPAKTTINTNIKTETITTNLSFTMLLLQKI